MHIGASLIAILIAAGLIIFGLAWFNESQANRIRSEAQAQATIIRAESDARFRDAQTSALMTAALIPMVLIITIGVVGSILALAVVIWVWKRQPQAPQVIERQIVYVLPEGAPRRELWQAWADTRQLQPIRREYEITERGG